MRLKRLFTYAMAVVLSVGVVSGCAKEDSKNVTTAAVVTEAATQETTQETTTAQDVTEEVTTTAEGENSNADEQIWSHKQEGIILVNPFMVSFAEGKEGTQIPATPEIEFDSNVELSSYQLTLVEIGRASTDMGYLKFEDVFAAGLVGSNGETVFKEEKSGWMDVYTKELSIAAYDHEDENNPYVAELHIDKNYHNEGEGYSDIPVKITELGLCPGQSVEVLKPFGMPSYAMCLEGKYYYYWQVETEDKVCCVEVVTSDGVIERLATAVY